MITESPLRTIPRAPWALTLLTLLTLLAASTAACSDETFGSAPDGGSIDAATSCVDGERRCVGATPQRCVGSSWQDEASCGAEQVCSADLGCVACDPALGAICYQGDSYGCQSDGSRGALLTRCVTEPCKNGRCGDSSCSPASQLIYVVDRERRLRSFDPRGDAHTFKEVGELSCPAASAWASWGSGTATPFAMTIDRGGRAWVLYTSGEIFWIDTKTGACSPSGYTPGTGGFELFTMAFVSASADPQGAGDDVLRLFGGGAAVFTAGGALGRLARLDTGAWTISGESPELKDGHPDLTGTGNGKLYGFLPGTDAAIAELDPKTGAALQRWSLGSLPDVSAWAFAHWGGRFYIFVTQDKTFGGSSSKVLRLDPKSGKTDEILPSIPYAITGAGVSTCAPVIK